MCMIIACLLSSNQLILCCPLLLLPSIFPSIGVFSNESVVRIMWPKYWSFSFSISPSNEYSGLISSRMDWLELLAVQGTLKSLLQHHSSKASIFLCSAFFIYTLAIAFSCTQITSTQKIPWNKENIRLVAKKNADVQYLQNLGEENFKTIPK